MSDKDNIIDIYPEVGSVRDLDAELDAGVALGSPVQPRRDTWSSRPSFYEIYLRLAGLMSARSTCRRLKVGCAIVSADFRKVLAVGYNGNASGQANDCDSDEPGRCGCLHAEENAVINCDSPREVSKIVLCTNLPCKMCAKRLVNLGNVLQVVYAEDYRLKDGLDVLSKAGIRYHQHKLTP